MQALRVRPMVDEEITDTVSAALGLDRSIYEAERIAIAAVGAHLLGDKAIRLAIASLHDETRPLNLPLVSERDAIFVGQAIGQEQPFLEGSDGFPLGQIFRQILRRFSIED